MTDLDAIIAHHTLDGYFHLSGGGRSSTYVDLRAALLCSECGDDLADWYVDQIKDDSYVPVATGTFGALLLGRFAEHGWGGILWNPKGHGLTWSGAELDAGTEVVLVDDVVTTGATLRALRAACEERGWTVAAEIIAQRAGQQGETDVIN